jgi:hypothetical protein
MTRDDIIRLAHRVIVCGGRNYDCAKTVYEVLDDLKISALANGGASGADTLCSYYAKDRNIPCKVYPARWELGKSAGPKRNAEMLNDFKPTLVVAFPGGRGTADMVQKAKSAGVEVTEIDAIRARGNK